MASPNENATLQERMTAYTDGYYQLAIYAFITGAIVILLSYWMNKLMINKQEQGD
jgi:POT family proton-dependent oligopeptide transporter